jgi:hypothetical protein
MNAEHCHDCGGGASLPRIRVVRAGQCPDTAQTSRLLAVQRVGSFLGHTGHQIDGVVMAARDPHGSHAFRYAEFSGKTGKGT